MVWPNKTLSVLGLLSLVKLSGSGYLLLVFLILKKSFWLEIKEKNLKTKKTLGLLSSR